MDFLFSILLAWVVLDLLGAFLGKTKKNPPFISVLILGTLMHTCIDVTLEEERLSIEVDKRVSIGEEKVGEGSHKRVESSKEYSHSRVE